MTPVDSRREISLAGFGILLAFCFWILCFREFLTGKLALTSDAVSYYNHIKFFIDNISRGIFPLWDSTWRGGFPNDFFLRRLCPYNPFYILIILFRTIGLPYTAAYLTFLCVYFFLGMLGFYKVAFRLLDDHLMALTAFLLLTFSALGTRLFDSYLIFVFTPGVWFFFFLMAMADDPKPAKFLGLTLSLMVVLNTYILFYFLVIFITFVFFYGCFYFRETKAILKRWAGFIRAHKVLVTLCAGALLISLIPGIMFFLEAFQGEIVLPLRHGGAATQNALSVAKNTVTGWGIPEDLMFTTYFDIRNFQLSLFYVPLFLFLLFFLGVFTSMTRRLTFYLVWTVVFLMFVLPYGTPLYHFLYRHIFFFKYFRNLHFFLWFLFLPLGILFVVEQFRQVLCFQWTSVHRKIWGSLFLVVIHLGFVWHLIHKQQTGFSSMAVIFLSFLFFVFYFLGKIPRKSPAFVLILFVLVCLNPWEAFHYLKKNSDAYVEPYRYDRPFWELTYTRYERDKLLPVGDGDDYLDPLKKVVVPNPYVATKEYALLMRSIDSRVLKNYFNYRFVLYDRVQFIDEDQKNTPEILDKIARVFHEKTNLAYVSHPHITQSPYKESGEERATAMYLQGDTPEFHVMHYSMNTVRIKTDFARPQFLVYNDNYHRDWRAFINGHETELYLANIAFKGLWIPSGENVVTLHFGYAWQYILNFGLMAVYYGLFLAGIFFLIKDIRQYEAS